MKSQWEGDQYKARFVDLDEAATRTLTLKHFRGTILSSLHSTPSFNFMIISYLEVFETYLYCLVLLLGSSLCLGYDRSPSFHEVSAKCCRMLLCLNRGVFHRSAYPIALAPLLHMTKLEF